MLCCSDLCSCQSGNAMTAKPLHVFIGFDTRQGLAFEIARQMKGVSDTLDLNAVTGVLEELRASREVERIPVGSKFRYRKLFRREAVA